MLILLAMFMGCASLSPFRATESSLRSFELGKNTGWSGFRDPTHSVQPELTLLRPYQPGKIPVVFIHGLLSSPKTWGDMLEGIQEDQELTERYQFWTFRYPTGISYLKSASDLRNQLISTVEDLDPEQQDPALSQMVLIGHSMGGLIAKLQVSASDGELWNAFSKVPLESLKVEEETAQQLSDIFWFEPLPFVRRVVLIATPHGGSTMTQGRLARFGRSLIEIPLEMQREFEQLVTHNSHSFRDDQKYTYPTSLDALDPDNPVLEKISHLKHSSMVSLHSIIGVGKKLPGGAEGDGVVSVESASLHQVDSEFRVPANHIKIHHTAAAISETRRILHLHLNTDHLNADTENFDTEKTALGEVSPYSF